jgi:preprotein translocase subunit YajC
MKTAKTLLLVLIVAISLTGLTTVVRAQDTAAPAAADTTADADAPVAADTPTAADTSAIDDVPVATDTSAIADAPVAPGISDDDNVTNPAAKTGGPSISGGNAPPTSQPAPKKQPGFFDGPMAMPMLIGAMLLMFVFMGRGKRKTEKKRKAMLATLKKGDKVTTIGGIIGTVMEVRDDEVTVKIDEGSNARMRFARWAVRGVGAEAKSETPDDKK